MVCFKGFVVAILLQCLPYSLGTSATTRADSCNKKENGYMIVNKEDCSTFYVCINQTPFLSHCPAGSYFNPRLGKCDSQATSDSCVKLGKGDICCDEEHGSIMAYPNDKYKYVICRYPLPEIVQCPANHIFHSKKKVCMEVGKKPDCAYSQSSSKYEYVGNCRKYFICQGIPKKADPVVCARDLLFDPYRMVCVSPNQYDCPY